jgi:CubicO group peptidase (beta-lactamase class C family)
MAFIQQLRNAQYPQNDRGMTLLHQRITAPLHRLAPLCVVLLFFSAVADARQAPWREGPVQNLLDRALSAAVEQNGWPGASAAIIHHDRIYVAAAGRRRMDRPERVGVNDRFGLGSNTKAFTAAMVGALVERGKLSWETTLEAGLPDIPMRAEYRAVTLRELMAHRAGLRPWTSPEAFARAETFYTGNLTTTRAAFARAALSDPPVAPPGSVSNYSNVDFVIAALIAERASGRSWQDLVTDYVMKPLQMRPRYAGTTVELDQPWPHSMTNGKLVPLDPSKAGPPVMQGAGGIALSISDYARFVQANLRGLEGMDTPILKAGTISELHKPVGDGPYGLGWHTQEFAGASSSVHAGGNGDFFALTVIQPGRDLAVIVLTNDGADETEDQAASFLKQVIAGLKPKDSR